MYVDVIFLWECWATIAGLNSHNFVSIYLTRDHHLLLFTRTWAFVKFPNVGVKVVLESRPLLGTGPLPD